MEEETQDDETAQSRRMALGEEEKQVCDYVTTGQGERLRTSE